MKFETFIKKVKSHLGVEIHGLEDPNGKYWFQYEGQIGSFRKQEKWDKPGVFEASGFHSRRVDDHSDIMTDYFAGSFHDNASQMLHWFKPPAAKFPVGTLVRGKGNKRATRQGYAGKTGLVMEASTYPKVQWLGEEYPPRYNYGYPERDLELVSAAA